MNASEKLKCYLQITKQSASKFRTKLTPQPSYDTMRAWTIGRRTPMKNNWDAQIEVLSDGFIKKNEWEEMRLKQAIEKNSNRLVSITTD